MNVKENQRDYQEERIERHGQHWAQDTERHNKTKNHHRKPQRCDQMPNGHHQKPMNQCAREG